MRGIVLFITKNKIYVIVYAPKYVAPPNVDGGKFTSICVDVTTGGGNEKRLRSVVHHGSCVHCSTLK